MRLGMSVTPHEYVEGVRLDHARNLLESTEAALKANAFDCGFAGPDQMRCTSTFASEFA